jgi:hypothetical protein
VGRLPIDLPPITSPGVMPALAAGEFGITSATSAPWPGLSLKAFADSAVMGWRLTPSHPRFTWPLASSWGRMVFASLIGMAKPIPTAPRIARRLRCRCRRPVTLPGSAGRWRVRLEGWCAPARMRRENRERPAPDEQDSKKDGPALQLKISSSHLTISVYFMPVCAHTSLPRVSKHLGTVRGICHADTSVALRSAR